MNWYSCDGEEKECNQPRVIKDDKMTDKWTIACHINQKIMMPALYKTNILSSVLNNGIDCCFNDSLCYMTYAYAMSLKQQSTGKYVPPIN